MKMVMNVNVVNLRGKDVNNPHPKGLSKSPAVAGFFVCGIEDGIGVFGAVGIDRHYMPIVP